MLNVKELLSRLYSAQMTISRDYLTNISPHALQYPGFIIRDKKNENLSNKIKAIKVPTH